MITAHCGVSQPGCFWSLCKGAVAVVWIQAIWAGIIVYEQLQFAIIAVIEAKTVEPQTHHLKVRHELFGNRNLGGEPGKHAQRAQPNGESESPLELESAWPLVIPIRGFRLSQCTSQQLVHSD